MAESTIYVNGAGSKLGFSTQPFRSSQWAGAIVVRATSSSTAQSLAKNMNAIINSGISYSQARGSGDILSSGLRSAKYADCSSAVSYAIQQAVGNAPKQTATGDGVSFAKSIVNTGGFMNYFYYQNGVDTPLAEGDILIYPNGGHTAIVVDGTARNGSNSELFTVNDKARGYEINWADFISEGDYEPRYQAPEIEPEDEYLPEEIIELLDLGVITKEDLEDEYDMYFIYEGRGGYSPFSEVPLTNKTYAFNRYAEILECKESCPLPQGDPGSWPGSIGEVSMAPELGSVMCFCNTKGGEGYACIVEEIYANEILITSQVEGGSFSIKTRQKRYGMWDFDSYMFTGFVHNPASYMGAEDESALETFLRIAQEQVGSGYEWTMQQTGILSPNGWSGAFVTACSKRAGSSLNIVIPNVDSVSTIGRVGVLRGMGTWHKGSIYGGGYSPVAGDIAIFRYHSTGKESIYQGSKAAIVVESNGGSFEGVMGDDGGYVSQKGYDTGCGFIAGYFSPNWESIDGTTASKKEYRDIQGLYTNGVSKYDACARTLCYLNPSYKPSISPSKVKIAAVNYTGLLANFYSVFGQAGISTASNAELVVDYWTNTVKSYYQQFPEDFESVSGQISNMVGSIAMGLTNTTAADMLGWYANSTSGEEHGPANVSVTASVKEVYDFLIGKGLNSAAATAVLANIQAESGFSTGAIGDSGTSAGLAQWHNNRMSQMKSYVGSDWATNVTGQLNYMWSELQGSYKGVLDVLQNVPNTVEGAKQATAKWIKSYEVPQGYNDPNSAVYVGYTDKNGVYHPGRLQLAEGFYSKLGG